MTGKPSYPSCVPSLERGLSILELLIRSKRGRSLSEVSRLLALPKSTTHCLLGTLKRLGYVTCAGTNGRHCVTLKVIDLGNSALRGLQLRGQTSPFLRALGETTRLTVHFAVLDQDDVVLVEKLDPVGTVRMSTWVGRRMEVHCTAVGKAILAHLPEEQVDRLIRQHGLPRHNENTLADPKKLKVDLERIRLRGYAVNDEEDEIGFRCVAAPILDQEARVIAAVSVAATTEQITGENLSRWAEEVRKTTAAISGLFRSSPS